MHLGYTTQVTGIVHVSVYVCNEGVGQGARDRLLENVCSMMKNLMIAAQQAPDALDVPRSEQVRYIAML